MSNVVPLNAPEFLTREEMATKMRVSVRTFDQMRYDGKRTGFPMPEIRWGGRIVLFEPHKVISWGVEFDRRKAAA